MASILTYLHCTSRCFAIENDVTRLAKLLNEHSEEWLVLLACSTPRYAVVQCHVVISKVKKCVVLLNRVATIVSTSILREREAPWNHASYKQLDPKTNRLAYPQIILEHEAIVTHTKKVEI